MTDTTIADIAREKELLDGSEWFEGQDNDGSFKSRIYGIRGTGIVPVTTNGDTPTDIEDFPQVVVVTSGGSAGDEVINLPRPTLDENGMNVPLMGQRVFVYLKTQTDPADVVVLHNNGSASWGEAITTTSQNFSPVQSYSRLALDFAGAAACLLWVGYRWEVDVMATNGNYTQTFSSFATPVLKPNDAGFMDVSGFPTVDPASPNAIWIDPANGHALAVSQG